ncbi:hypothetical protein K470DRAFT_256323, partial [Piedraia hortae CBS 480.64]
MGRFAYRVQPYNRKNHLLYKLSLVLGVPLPLQLLSIFGCRSTMLRQWLWVSL